MAQLVHSYPENLRLRLRELTIFGLRWPPLLTNEKIGQFYARMVDSKLRDLGDEIGHQTNCCRLACMRIFQSHNLSRWLHNQIHPVHSFSYLRQPLTSQSKFIMSSPIYGTLKRKPNNLPPSSPTEAKKPKTDSSITSFFGAPKSIATSPAIPKFDKAKWVAKLTPEQRTLVKLEIDTLDESWLAHLKDEILAPSFLNLKRFLKNEIDSGKKVFPPLEEIYSW